MKRQAALIACLALTTLTNEATAEKPESSVETQPQKGWPEDVPVMRWWEYAGGAALLGGSFAIRFTVDVSGEPTFSRGLLMDDATYDATFIDSPHLFRSWRTIGDIGYFSAFAWSLVDPLIAGFSYDWGTMLQMTMMNLEAFSVYSMILSVSQLIVRRQRPATRECEDPEKAAALGVSCGLGNANVNRSFIGGHTGTVATAATLTCVHHINLPLWGDPGADALPCVASTALTALVFTSRTIIGQHAVTDNLLGVGVGVFSGLVPWTLHYAIPLFDKPTDAEPQPVQPASAMVVPVEGGVSLQVSGLLF